MWEACGILLLFLCSRRKKKTFPHQLQIPLPGCQMLVLNWAHEYPEQVGFCRSVSECSHHKSIWNGWNRKRGNLTSSAICETFDRTAYIQWYAEVSSCLPGRADLYTSPFISCDEWESTGVVLSWTPTNATNHRASSLPTSDTIANILPAYQLLQDPVSIMPQLIVEMFCLFGLVQFRLYLVFHVKSSCVFAPLPRAPWWLSELLVFISYTLAQISPSVQFNSIIALIVNMWLFNWYLFSPWYNIVLRI